MPAKRDMLRTQLFYRHQPYLGFLKMYLKGPPLVGFKEVGLTLRLGLKGLASLFNSTPSLRTPGNGSSKLLLAFGRFPGATHPQIRFIPFGCKVLQTKGYYPGGCQFDPFHSQAHAATHCRIKIFDICVHSRIF